MRLQTLVTRLVGVLALSGCQLYFPPSPHVPPDSGEACGGCDAANPQCPVDLPDGSCHAQSQSCSYGGDACGLDQTTCWCADGTWSCTGPGQTADAAGQMCGLMEAEHVPEHSGWTLSCGSVDHGGESLTADLVNATFSFGFTGTSLDVYYEMGPNDGTFSVTVDAAPPVIVNAYQPGSFTFQNPTTIASGLPDEPHTATITCTSLYCDIDYFTVACE